MRTEVRGNMTIHYYTREEDPQLAEDYERLWDEILARAKHRIETGQVKRREKKEAS